MTDSLPAIRLLGSDVDGTLVRKDKTLAPATIDAARRLQQAGGTMTLISARPPSGILPLARQLGLGHEIGAFNGGTVLTLDGTIVHADRLDAEASRTATRIIRDAGETAWVFADDQWFSTDDTNPHTDSERRSAMVEPVIVADFDALHGRVDKVVAVCDDPDAMAALEADIAAALGDSAQVSLSQTYYCDITHPKANKGDGITALSRAIGIPLSQTAAIGDMANDLPMFARAALSIAMGQGPEKVRAAADHVTLSNEEDGVAAAIDARILPALARTRL
jgi:hypothetical protein